MQVVRVYRLNNLSPTHFRRLKQAQMEAARVWNECMETHKEARLDHLTWPNERTLRQAVKGSFALHSQSIQAIVRTFVTTIATTRKLRKEHPEMRMKYPWRVIRFYPVKWPAQAVHQEKGRGIRSLKRQRSKQLGQLAKKQNRCRKYSRRWKKLQRAKNKLCRRTERRVRDLRHKATRQVIDFCVTHRVGTLFIGNPHGVRRCDSGRHHNGRMAQWEYGKDIDYLAQKSTQARISCSTGSERGTSSRCPRCGHKHKPRGRRWACRACGFTGHRDLVGSVNMHPLAFSTHPKFPRSFTYLRPGPLRVRKRSSRADTPRRCLDQPPAQPHLAEMAPLGAGSSGGDVQKPVP